MTLNTHDSFINDFKKSPDTEPIFNGLCRVKMYNIIWVPQVQDTIVSLLLEVST